MRRKSKLVATAVTLTIGVFLVGAAAGPADAQSSEGFVLSGDWDGDGVDTVGLFVPADRNNPNSLNTWLLRNSNTTGVADLKFTFGRGWFPVVGDWDGEGTDTVGLYSQDARSIWLLRNSNSSGPADLNFAYGDSGWPVVGDWDGNDRGTPVVGDWDGDGVDTIGLVSGNAPNRWFLRNTNTAGSADVSFEYGDLGRPLTGDWDGGGHQDTPGIMDSQFNPYRWYLRLSNTSGIGDIGFEYG